LLLGGLREVLPTIVTHRSVEFVGRAVQLRLSAVFGRTERRFTIALPVAAAAAAATTSSTSSVAQVAFTRGTFLRWL